MTKAVKKAGRKIILDVEFPDKLRTSFSLLCDTCDPLQQLVKLGILYIFFCQGCPGVKGPISEVKVLTSPRNANGSQLLYVFALELGDR